MDLGDNFIRSSYSAPCKTIFSGEHSVVYSEDALVMAVNLRTFAEMTIAPAQGSIAQFQIDFTDQMSSSIIPLKDIACVLKENQDNSNSFQAFSESSSLKQTLESFKDQGDHSRLSIFLYALDVVALYLIKHLRLEISSLFNLLQEKDVKISIKSSVPIAKGLGSSASYLTALSATLLTGLSKLLVQQLKDSTELEKAQQLYLGDGLLLKKVVNELALELEKIYHGTPSGIDTQITTYGGILLFNKTYKERIRQISCFEMDYELILIDSGVEKDTKRAVGNVRERFDSKVCGVVTGEILKSIGKITNTIIDFLENKGQGSQRDFENLINANNYLLCALGLGHPKLTEINKICEEYAVAFKITGAGQGGYGLAFLSSSLSVEKKERFMQALSLAGFEHRKLEVSREGLKSEAE